MLVTGISLLSYYSYTLADEYVYQAYQNWAFDQQISGRPQVNFVDYLRERTPLGVVMKPAPAVALAPSSSVPVHPRPQLGALLGRLDVPRLNLSAIVREGASAGILSRAVGHVPSTAQAGEPGNFAIAAHRDTLFRALKDIQKGDIVTFQTSDARYTYEVFSMRVVKPSEVSVLRPDGGPNGAFVEVSNQPTQMLTMITCYPFHFVGSAPERFIVQARLVSAPGERPSEVPAESAAKAPAVRRRTVHRPGIAAHEPRRTRDFSTYVAHPVRKHGFWHGFFHAS